MAGKCIPQSVLWIAAAIVLSATLAPSAAEFSQKSDTAPLTKSSSETTTNSSETTTNSIETTTNSTNSTVTDPTEEPTNSTVEPTTGASTAAPPPPTDPCEVNPCGQGSTCEPRANETFVCLCLPGNNYNYTTMSCESAKVFPGELTVPKLPYNDAMKNKESPEFQQASKQITDALDKTFKDNKAYTGSTVLELQEVTLTTPSPSARASVVRASVEMFFRANSDVTTNVVTGTLDTATGVLANSTFKETDLCTRGACDAQTTTCTSGDGIFTCTCVIYHVPSPSSNTACVTCPGGTKAADSECKPCPFGYSGLNCSENWKLILVIVGSVLGGLLLIALILLPVMVTKSKKSAKKDRNEDIGKPYMSHSPAKAPLAYSFSNSQPVSASGSGNGVAGFASTGVPKIPRATANSSWDSRTNLEMTLSNSRQNLMGKSSDDFNPYTRSMSSLNSQARPQSNPYTQNRLQSNPYGQSQGYNNPYYSQDEGRRF